jgi:hypothetical protein
MQATGRWVVHVTLVTRLIKTVAAAGSSALSARIEAARAAAAAGQQMPPPPGVDSTAVRAMLRRCFPPSLPKVRGRWTRITAQGCTQAWMQCIYHSGRHMETDMGFECSRCHLLLYAVAV